MWGAMKLLPPPRFFLHPPCRCQKHASSLESGLALLSLSFPLLKKRQRKWELLFLALTSIPIKAPDTFALMEFPQTLAGYCPYLIVAIRELTLCLGH